MLVKSPLKVIRLCIRVSWRTDSGIDESNYGSSERMFPKVKMLGNQEPTANELNAKKRAILRCVQGEITYFINITPAAYFDLLSKQMLAWYKRTFKQTLYWLSAVQFCFLRRNKRTKLSTSKHLLSTAVKTPALYNTFKIASFVVTFLTGRFATWG